MMKKSASILLLSAFYIFNPQLQAEHFISSKTIIENALKTQDELIRLNGDIDRAKAQQSIGVSQKDPQLRISYGQQTNVDIENQSDQYPEEDYSMGLRFFPMNPWEAKAMELGSDALVSYVQTNYTIAKNELISEILFLIKEIEYRQKNLNLLQEKKDILSEHIDDLESLVKSNQITVDRLLKAKAKSIETNVDYSDEANKLSNCIRELENRSSLPLDTNIRIVSEDLIKQQIKSPPLTPKRLVNYLNQHPQLKCLEAQEKMSTADIKKAQAFKIPWFNHIEISHSVKETWGYEDETSIQFALNIPIFSWTQKEDRIPQQKLSNLRLRKRNLREKLRQQIESAYQEMETKISKLQQFETEMNTLEKELENLLKSNESHTGITGDIDIPMQLIETKLNRNKLRYACIQSILKYQQLLPSVPSYDD